MTPSLQKIYSDFRTGFQENADVVDQADKKLEFIDSEIGRLSALDLKDGWYYGILFLKGISCYELRDYKTSTRIFSQLIKIDDRNDNYKNCLSYSRYGEQQWLVRVLNIVFGLMVVIAVLLRGFIPNASLRFVILGIGVLGLTANWGYEHYIRRSFRKVK